MAGEFILDYQKQEQNIRRLAQMVQAIASMPEQNKRQVEREVGRAESSRCSNCLGVQVPKHHRTI